MTENRKTPKLRFKGFTDAWEQRKLGDIGTITTGSTPSTSIPDYYSDDGIIWVTPTDISENITFKSARKLSELGQQVGRVVPKNTILVTCIASIGKNTMLGNTGSFNQQINGLTPNENKYEPYFLLIESEIWSAQMRKSAAAGTMQIINRTEFSGLETWIPKLNEQKVIGTYFRNLDNLITLHQRKLDRLKNIKKSMLDKMFPKDGEVVPEIRFKGFTDAWEQRKLGEVLISLQNNTLSRTDLSSEQGIAKNVHYGDILVKFGEVIDVKTESLPMIVDEVIIAKYKSSFLQNGDVIVADTAEDETVGKCTEIAGLSDEIVISGLHTIPYRPLQKFASGYLGYYMNSASFHNQLLPLMQGIKVTSISKTALQNTDILYPKSTTEQADIGKYFSHLDNLITLHQRKLDKLKNIKKSMLDNMFV